MNDKYMPNRIVESILRAPFTKVATHPENIRRVLQYAPGVWVCGSAFYANFIPTYSQRIGKMRRDGDPIARGICSNPGHRHKGTLAQYRWIENE